MANYGIKISRPGFDATDIPSEATKKNYVNLNDVADAHKIRIARYVTGGSYSHGLSKVPFFYAFQVDSTSSPTYFRPVSAEATNTQITGLPSNAYIIIFNEGN